MSSRLGERRLVEDPRIRDVVDDLPQIRLGQATGEAGVGLGLRSAARTLELDFVPVLSEPFEIATSSADAGGLQPLIRALGDASLRERIAGLGGYDLADAGAVRAVG